jgi:hypothetical protein
VKRRKLGRVLVGLGIGILVWAVFAFCNATIGGPPAELHFSERLSYTEVKRATHAAFFPLVVRALAGMLILLGGSRLLQEGPDAS